MRASTRMPHPHDQRLVGEHQTAASVRDDPPDEGGDDDGQAAHRRGARLGGVVVGATVLLAEDRLTLAAVAEEGDQVARAEQRQDHRHRPADHHRDHESRSRATIAIVEGQHLVADRLGGFVALAGDDHDVTRAGFDERRGDGPAAVGLDHEGATVAGLDPVDDGTDDDQGVFRPGVVGGDDDAVGKRRGDRTHLRALGRVAIAACAEHDDHPAGEAVRAGRGRARRAAPPGVWAKSTSTSNGWPARDRLEPARHRRRSAQPGGDLAPGSRPRTAHVVAAARLFDTLNRPPMPTSISCTAPAVGVTGDADAQIVDIVERVRLRRDLAPSASSRRPCSSSALTTARAASSGANNDAFAAKYASTVPCRSRWSWPRLVNTATSKRQPATRW